MGSIRKRQLSWTVQVISTEPPSTEATFPVLRPFGSFGCGEVFELSPSGAGAWTKTLLHAFTDSPDGRFPAAGLAFNKAGHLFGTTPYGGSYESGLGTLYELVPQSGGGWTESVVYSFGNDGWNPYNPVIVNGAGNIFGTTVYGGTESGGTVYEFTGVSAR